MINRRGLLKSLLGGAAGFFSLGGYALAIEPQYRLDVARYTLPLPRWPQGARPLTMALISDLHASDPWMSQDRIAEIVETTNRIGADMVLLLGDYMSSLRWQRSTPEPRQWAAPLAALSAPLGVHAILGNHDYWWHGGPRPVVAALREVGIRVLLNSAVRIDRDGHRFWLGGTESQLAHRRGPGDFVGRDDLRATLARVPDDLPVILMAHEPMQFARVPERVALTLSGHTHGGQVSLPFFGPPVVAAHRDLKWVRGHYVDDGRHLVVSSGLGCTFVPVRFLVPPEITVVRVEAQQSA